MKKEFIEIIMRFHARGKERQGDIRTDADFKILNKQIAESFRRVKNVHCPLCGSQRYMYHGEDDSLWSDYPFVCVKCENAFVIVDACNLI